LFNDSQVSRLGKTNTPGGKNTIPPVAEAAVIADRIAAVSSVEPSPTAPYVLILNTCPPLSLTVEGGAGVSVGLGVRVLAGVGNGVGLVFGCLSEARAASDDQSRLAIKISQSQWKNDALASARKDLVFCCCLFIPASFATRRAYSVSGPDSESSAYPRWVKLAIALSDISEAIKRDHALCYSNVV